MSTEDKTADLVERLWASDEASALTNQAAREIERLRAEIAGLRTSVIAFGGPWAAEYARQHEMPTGHLHHVHYDILARAGALMDDFVRSEESANA